MIAVSLVLIVTITGTVYLNNFNTQQKLNQANNEIESMVKLAQNYAKIKQSPVGNSDEVLYVRLKKNGSSIEADINGIGTTYFSNKINESGLTVTFTPSEFYFWGGSGKLSADANGTFLDADETFNISIALNQGTSETKTIVINSLGGIQ